MVSCYDCDKIQIYIYERDFSLCQIIASVKIVNNIDPSERDGYKWYCELNRRYEDPDEVQECSNYRER